MVPDLFFPEPVGLSVENETVAQTKKNLTKPYLTLMEDFTLVSSGRLFMNVSILSLWYYLISTYKVQSRNICGAFKN